MNNIFNSSSKSLQKRACATKTDENERYVSGSGFWGYCGPECLTHEEAINNPWSTDETVQMTLQYDNTALWTGLELYGYLLTGILIVGLILTTVLPAFGKIISRNYNCDKVEIVLSCKIV